MRKFVSLVLALSCITALAVPAFAADINTAGGTGSADVPLTVEAPTFSVTVPMQLPITVDADGAVTTATDAAIVNKSHGMVQVSNVTVTGANSWALVDFETNMGAVAVNSKKIALKLNGDVTGIDGAFGFTAANWPTIAAKNDADTTDEMAIVYDAKVPAQSTAVDGTTVANVVFTVGWATQAAEEPAA